MTGIDAAVGWLGTRPDMMVAVALVLMALAMVFARGRSA